MERIEETETVKERQGEGGREKDVLAQWSGK